MDTAALHLFDLVARHGSFAAAAREVDRDPSTISRIIAGLEAELNVRLFERSTRRLALTEAGATYHDRIAPLLTELDLATVAARDMAQTPMGTLRISASTAFGAAVIVPMLPAFLARYPDLSVDLRLTDAQVDLLHDRIDVAIRMTPDAPAETRRLRLWSTRYRVVAAPGTVALDHPTDLAGLDCIVFPYPEMRDTWQFRRGAEALSVPVHGRTQITGAGAMLAAAEAGLGPTLLADWLIAASLEEDRLVDLLPDWDCAGQSFDTAAWALMPPGSYRPLKTTVFLDALRSLAPTG